MPKKTIKMIEDLPRLYYDIKAERFITKEAYDLRCKNFQFANVTSVYIIRQDIFESMCKKYNIQLEMEI